MSKLFINGCSFLTTRPRENVHTHSGNELAKLLQLEIAVNLANGGRGNKRTVFTTKTWCEKYPDVAKDCFFYIGITSGTRFDYPTNDGYKKHKFPSLTTTWKTFSPQKEPEIKTFFKYLFSTGADLDQMIQIESLLAILDLQNYFELKKYPYVFFKTISDSNIINSDIKLLYDKIERKRFYKLETSHYDWIHENSLISNNNDPHPSTEGHVKWAEQIKDFIDVNNLRTI